MPFRVVVVDDDVAICALVREHLMGLALDVETFHTLKTACERLAHPPTPQLVILDRNLPDGDGTQLRQVMLKDPELHGVPVLFMTVLEATQGRTSVVRDGADDYLIKPFRLAELETRVRAMLQMPPSPTGPFWRCGDVELDAGVGRAMVAGRPIELQPMEFETLKLFISQPGRMVTENILLQKIWGRPFVPPGQNPVPAAIEKLRAALGPAGRYLKGDGAHGYRFELD